MIGFSCPPLTVKPFEQVAELVIPNFQHWEIISEANHWLPNIQNEVKELLETTNMKLSIHGPYSDVNLGAFDLGTRKYAVKVFLDIINICSELGIGPVTAHPGVIGPIQHWDRPRALKYTRESLEMLVKEASDNSMLIALENMPEMRFTTCQTAKEIEKTMNGLNIGMCFDIGHAHTTNQMSEMMALKDKFINVHVHDNLGDRDAHLPLGQGTIDFSVLKELTGYKGNFIIESKVPEVEEALASKQYLEKLFG
jgi:sugar phosphate isomerase/epimerase